MTQPDAASELAYQREDQDSVLASANVLLRWRRTIISLGLFGIVLGLVWGLTTPYRYMSTARFIPQAAEGGNSALAMAASQFGIRVPSGGSGVWGPPVYVELLRSRALLEPILFDTMVVAEEKNRRATLIELLEIEATNPRRRLDLAVEDLRGMVKATEETKLNAVELEVTTQWPSVSYALANRLLQRINEFNFEIRKSQARAERQFVEQQSRQAEQALRDAEYRLQLFLQRNRACCSPELAFERDRLQREVSSRQMLYSSWLERSEEARIREVRDTPVITVIENPQIPSEREARGTVKKAFFLGLFFATLGVLAAFLSRWIATARAAHTDESREFFHLVGQATPRFLRKVRK